MITIFNNIQQYYNAISNNDTTSPTGNVIFSISIGRPREMSFSQFQLGFSLKVGTNLSEVIISRRVRVRSKKHFNV